jgi:MFS family permease
VHLDPYRRVLAEPGVKGINQLGIAARVPHAATSVVLTVHVVQRLGRGYAAAGLVVAAWTIGAALGAPWRGRMVDRLGLRRALLPSLVAEALVWCSAPWLPFEWLVPAVVVGGVLGLPVFTVIRLALSVMVPDAQRRTAFALDSMSVEVAFMVGPALGVLVATRVSTTVALSGIGVLAVLAGVGLSVLDPPTRTPVPVGAPADDGPPKRHRVPVTSGLIAVLAATAAATVVLAGTDVSLIASLRGTGQLGWTGLVAAVWAGASLLGGLVYGLLPKAVPPFLLLLGLGVLTVPVGLVHGPLALSLIILPAGFLCAPVITATADVLTRLVPEEVRGEAMGWHGSALTAGTALGAPLAGFAIDTIAPSAGFAAVGLAGVVLAVLGLAAVRLRGRGRVLA